MEIGRRARQAGRALVMLGPDLQARGGMAAVANNWSEAGLFDRWRVIYIATYRDAGKLRKLVIALSALGRLMLLIALRRVALIHVHAASRMSFWRKAPFIALAHLTGVPLVLHIHGGNFRTFYEQECSALQRRMIRWLAGRAQRVIALSSYWREQFGAFCAPQRISVVPNFVVAPLADAARARKPTQLLFLGQLGESKGLRELFQAVALLRAEFPAVRLVCAGDGDFEAVRKWLEEFGVADAVELPGWVGPQVKWELLRTSSAFVLASHTEAMPVALLEAMAAGTPCVATRVGAVPEVIENEVNGLLVEPKDVSALATACRRLLAQPEYAGELAARAQERMATLYSPPQCLRALEGVYEDALSARAAMQA